MGNGRQVNELLSRWQQLRADGQEISAEELCSGAPELAAELAERIRAVLAGEDEPQQLATCDFVPDGADNPLVTSGHSSESHDHSAGGQMSTGDFRSSERGDTAVDDLPPVLSSGRYEVLDELGSGSFGKVFRALGKKLGDALANAGRGAEVGPMYLAVADGSTSLDKLEFQRQAMEQLLLSGVTEEGFRIVKELFEKIGVRLPISSRHRFFSMLWENVRLRIRGLNYKRRPTDAVTPEQLWKIDLVHSAGHRLAMLDVALSTALLTRATLWALDSGDISRIARALSIAAALIGLEGCETRSRAEHCIEKALDLNSQIGDPFWTAYAVHNAGILNWCYGRWKEALARFDQVEQIALEGQVSFASYRTALQLWTLDCLMMTGRWRDYFFNVDQYFEDARRRGDRFATSVMLIHSYLRELAFDRPDNVNELVQKGWERWPLKGNVMGDYWGLYGRVEAAIYCKEGKKALDLLRNEQGELNKNTYFKFIQLLNFVMIHLHGRAALAAAQEVPATASLFGKRSRLLRTAAKRCRTLERRKIPWSNPLAGLLRAGIANLRDQNEQAIKLLAAAEKELADADMEMYRAAACRQRGRLIGGDEGRALVAEADGFMTGQDVKEPARIAAMLVPGFGD